MSPSPRRVPQVLAGVLAMAASLTALATVVWSDLAQATEAPEQVELLADELPQALPVKVTKVEHKQPGLTEDDLFFLDTVGEKPPAPGKRKGRINFGHFEGY